MIIRSSIRISAAAFTKAGLRMTSDTADELEAALMDEAGCRSRISMIGSHAAIEVDTDCLIDAARTLQGLDLI